MGVMSEDFVIVRQNNAVVKLRFETLTVEDEVKIGQYVPHTPIAIYQNKFYELNPKNSMFTVVDLGQMRILSSCELRNRCPEPLKEPTFLQFKNVLLVQTGKNFYIFDLLKQKWTKLNTGEAPVSVKDAMILMPNSKNIYLVMNKQIVHYDTFSERFTVEKT